MCMIMCDENEWNIFNPMIIIGMLEMNYMVNGLMFLQTCFKKQNVVLYVE
jgi:hypothetical protein